MNSFGLGLVLDFTDNASGGMQSVMNTFNQLNGLVDQTVENASNLEFSVISLVNAGMGMNTVGSQLMSFGGKLTSAITGTISSITTVGSTLASARNQLSTLYGSIEDGEKVLQRAKSYAATSIFNFEDLLPSIVMLKANGIEAFDEISNSAGKTGRVLMDYAADLAAFNPQMRNAYGTGIQAAMGALNEYIAEGNTMSLKRGASLDILQLLGEEKGATIEERTRQVADLIDQLGMTGAVSNLAGTAGQKLSNLEDIFFNLKAEISDAGVFDSYTRIIQKVTSSLLEETIVLEDGTEVQNKFFISAEKWTNFSKIVADAIMGILEPIENLAAKVSILISDFVNFTNEHPKLAKFLITATAIVGVATVGAGALLKLGGSFFMLTGGLLQTALLMSRGITFGNMFRNSFRALNAAILPLVATAILLYEVWDKNIFGIRDILKQAFGEIGNIISLAFGALADNTLSYEQFEKAKELGILPFIEAILQLKHHLGHLFEGFKAGFTGFFSAISDFLPKIQLVSGFFYDIANKVGEFIGKFTGIGADKGWENFGKVLGTVAGALATALPLIKGAKIAIGLFSGPLGIITAAISVLAIAWKNDWGGIQERVKGIFEWFKGLNWEEMWGKIKVAIQPVIDWFNSIDWNAIFGTIFDTLQTVFEAALPILDALVGTIKAIFGGIFTQDNSSATSLGAMFDLENSGEQFANMGEYADKLGTALEKPVTLIGTLGETIKVIGGVISDLMPLVQTVINIVSGVVTKVVEVLNQYIIPTVSRVVTKVLDLINGLVEKIRPLIQRLVSWVTEAWNGWLGDLVRNIIEFVGLVIENVGAFIGWIIDTCGPFIEGAVDAIAKAIDIILEIVLPVVDVVGTVINTIIEVINGIISFITNIFTGNWQGAWDAVCGIFEDLWNGLCDIFKSIINVLIGVVNGIIKGLNFLKVPDWVPGIGGFGINIPEIPYLSTGGEITGEGVSYLHPNEVVVNSDTTNGLRDFLTDYKNGSAGIGEELVANLISSGFDFLGALQTLMSSALTTFIDVMRGTKPAEAVIAPSSTSIDHNIGSITNNSITNNSTTTNNEVVPAQSVGDTIKVEFAAGSIVIQASGSSVDEITDEFVDKLAKKLKRKLELQGLAVRK